MKYMFIFAFLWSFLLLSQDCIVEYNVVYGLSIKKGGLVFSPMDTSFYYEYEEAANAKDREVKKGVTEEGYQATTIRLAGYEDRKHYQIYVPNKDTLFSVSYLADKSVLVYEDAKPMSWKIEAETKEIAGYNCNRASVLFRGRKYEAWFTTSIPINTGPWKFNGLPGAILQVYDESQEYSWTATKISFSKSKEQLELEKGISRMPLKQFHEEHEAEMMEKVNSAIMRFLPKGAKIQSQKSGGGRELKFEWEDTER